MNALVRDPDALAQQRTKDSLTFETAWRALPRRGCLPDRSALSLHGFKKLLPDMALIDILPGTPPSSRVCLVGERIRERIPFPVIGQDYFHYVPAHMRDTAEQRLQTLVRHPCGLWQVLGIHYQRGLFKSLEITALPFRREEGPPQIMVLAVYSRGQVCDVPTDLAMISLDRATATTFLDIGAGVPRWPPAPDSPRPSR
ncbi:MAG TPA: hypothetical protein VLT91_14885 [Rhizomicrobium sp.]|nr:hypothetical protein [Rhizomicrobium sp.]